MSAKIKIISTAPIRKYKDGDLVFLDSIEGNYIVLANVDVKKSKNKNGKEIQLKAMCINFDKIYEEYTEKTKQEEETDKWLAEMFPEDFSASENTAKLIANNNSHILVDIDGKEIKIAMDEVRASYTESTVKPAIIYRVKEQSVFNNVKTRRKTGIIIDKQKAWDVFAKSIDDNEEMFNSIWKDNTSIMIIEK